MNPSLPYSIIHPQNRSGEPIINPHGRYMISFNLNGCRRKVELDDRLPVGKYGELLCSYSSNDDEFWISIIEKAYMKVSCIIKNKKNAEL